MKQKLAIACGLLHAPHVLFFDEPLTGLDPLGIRRMKDTIVERARGAARRSSSARTCCTWSRRSAGRVLILQGGRTRRASARSTRSARSPRGLARDASLEDIFLTVTAREDATPS